MLHDEMDGDFLQAELYKLGNKYGELKARGICGHGWWTHLTCNYCGKTWENETAMLSEHRILLRG